jgi:hypothetical protein
MSLNQKGGKHMRITAKRRRIQAKRPAVLYTRNIRSQDEYALSALSKALNVHREGLISLSLALGIRWIVDAFSKSANTLETFDALVDWYAEYDGPTTAQVHLLAEDIIVLRQTPPAMRSTPAPEAGKSRLEGSKVVESSQAESARNPAPTDVRQITLFDPADDRAFGPRPVEAPQRKKSPRSPSSRSTSRRKATYRTQSGNWIPTRSTDQRL